MLKTRFTELVGCEAPLQLAAMPGIATPALAAAVSEAGGLGMIGAPLTPPEVVRGVLDAIAGLTAKPFGANFLVPFLEIECLKAVIGRVRLVEFFYGDPDRELVDLAHSGGSLVSWQVGSVAEARRAVDAGCDVVVAQGVEAGGHVRGRVGLLPLLGELCDAVDVPVIAAGGISTARAMAGALAAGASAVRVGTRFIAAEESEPHPDYLARVLAANAEDTEYTEAFSVMWPNAPHRVLRSAIEAARSLPEGPIGEVKIAGKPMAVPRFAVLPPSRGATGRVDAMALYAGQSVGAVREVKPAREVVRELCGGAERLLRAWS